MTGGLVPRLEAMGDMTLREAQDRLCDALGHYGTVEDAVAEYVEREGWAWLTEARYDELADAITATWERPDDVDPDDDRSDW